MTSGSLALGALLSLVLFALLAWRVARSPDGDAFRLDAVVRGWAEPHFHPRGRIVAHAISLPGYPGLYMPAAALGAWLLRARGADDALALPIAVLMAWVGQRIVKRFLDRTRPPTPAARGKKEPAFPSGHTTGTTALVLAGALLLARAGLLSWPWALGIATGIAVLVALSRIYLDEHWATDVLGGFALGGAAALLGVALS